MHFSKLLALLSLAVLSFSNMAAACNFDDDSLYNKCPFVPCFFDVECSSGNCSGHDFCAPEGW